MDMIKTIVLPNTFSQENFNMAVRRMKDFIGEDVPVKIVVRDPISGNAILLAESYIDIDVTDEGGCAEFPMFWYNKKELDERNIKY